MALYQVFVAAWLLTSLSMASWSQILQSGAGNPGNAAEFSAHGVTDSKDADGATAPPGDGRGSTLMQGSSGIQAPPASKTPDDPAPSGIAQTLFPRANTSWGPSGNLVSVLNKNALVGVTINNSVPATPIFPVGTVGYGLVYPGASGNTAFGLYGEADLVETGTAVGAEIDCFNYKGEPDNGLPPDRMIGTSSNVCMGLQIGAGGLYNGSVGLLIGGALGGVYAAASPQRWNTGLYMAGASPGSGGAAQFGIFVDADSKGPSTSAVLQNYGNGINLQLGTTGKLQDDNSVISVVDRNGISHFSVRQAGDIYSTGKLEFLQSARPTLSSCGNGPSINNSTDQAGVITAGTGTVTSCTVTFSSGFRHTPACVITGEATGPIVFSLSRKSASSITVAASANIAGSSFDYACLDLN